ncbi:hypothetical protein Mgra_00005191 [Meloidogyne graminicola]|uniref:WD_REPEATS_REGION domain-containing protein n=1 Tax=Meloidogyne graminicola TaxID=189291 RepID=A0A8S9ZQ39_9BILA|nr:hypothetical protein Mgra_00005191 [Meloidogyne graminicola]
MPQESKDTEQVNAKKKARQFDFDLLFAQTIGSKQTENETNEFSRISLKEEVEELTKEEKTKYRKQLNRKLMILLVLKFPEGLLNSATVKDNEDEQTVGPPLPSGFIPDKNLLIENYDEFNYGFDEEELKTSTMIPASYEVSIKTETNKAITAIAYDLQGAKFAVGTASYSVNLYEFQRMDSSMHSFRQVYPCESHIINDLAFSNNAENLLVGSSSPIIILLDRQGSQWAETVRGDQYLVDPANTKGHTAAVNSVCWHPLNKTEFLTCADDGTLRLWDIEDYKDVTKCINTQRKLIKTKNSTGKRALATTCCYSRDGKLIAAGCDDGSIQVWKNGKIFVNTTYLNRTAHNNLITRLQFSPDNERIISRSMDDTLKLWNLKDFKKPLKTANNLKTIFPQTDCGYSPHAEFIFTATNDKSREGGEQGTLLFFDSETLELLYKIEYENQGCIRALWHPKINQIFVGLSDGTCKIYYDPSISIRGAIQCIGRPVKRLREKEVVKEELILSPLTLEMFQPRGEDGEEREVTEWRLRKYLRMHNKEKRPLFRQPAAMPMSGPSTGGRIRPQGGTLHSFVAKEMGLVRNKEFIDDEDIRTAILRHAEEAEKDPQFISKAYSITQPTPIFQESTEESKEEEEDNYQPIFKVPRLG